MTRVCQDRFHHGLLAMLGELVVILVIALIVLVRCCSRAPVCSQLAFGEARH